MQPPSLPKWMVNSCGGKPPQRLSGHRLPCLATHEPRRQLPSLGVRRQYKSRHPACASSTSFLSSLSISLGSPPVPLFISREHYCPNPYTTPLDLDHLTLIEIHLPRTLLCFLFSFCVCPFVFVCLYFHFFFCFCVLSLPFVVLLFLDTQEY